MDLFFTIDKGVNIKKNCHLYRLFVLMVKILLSICIQCSLVFCTWYKVRIGKGRFLPLTQQCYTDKFNFSIDEDVNVKRCHQLYRPVVSIVKIFMPIRTLHTVGIYFFICVFTHYFGCLLVVMVNTDIYLKVQLECMYFVLFGIFLT